jgi:hypothetical protein
MDDAENKSLLQKRVDESTAEYLKDKRIVLVGPAPYLENKGLGPEIDSFDCVVRLKNGFPVEKDMQGDFGCRTDIYYTNLNFGQHSFCGEVYKKMNTLEMIIVPCPINESKRIMFKLIKKNHEAFLDQALSYQKDFCVPIKTDLDPDFFNRLQRAVGTRPTMGLLTIMDLLQYPIKELYVKGFTFRYNLLELQSKCRSGNVDWVTAKAELKKIYCNNYKNKKQLKYSWEKTLKNNLHNIEKEFIFFKNLIGIDHRIVIDDHMKNIFNPSNKVK